jgi:predicted nucleic acid-binding protein
MICLDNSVLRKFADPNPDPAVVAYLKDRGSEQWIVPAIIAYEFYSIETRRTDIQRVQSQLHAIIDEIRPFTDAVAVEAAALEGSLTQQNQSLATADLLSAATAREAGATFVTADKNDFDKRPLHELMDVDIIDVS